VPLGGTAAEDCLTEEEAATAMNPIYADLADAEDFPDTRPLLAHYTSLSTLERILETDELWFSNPLVMNDLEEIRFGILRGSEKFGTSASIEAACGTRDRVSTLREAYTSYFRRFDDDHAFDTYVFCLSRHDPADSDGMLSMWRGYGGNGTGAAIVFDTAHVPVTDGAPLIVARVHYATTEQRLQWLDGLMERIAAILAAANLPTDRLYVAAYHLFERIKLFALFSKHYGFREENEWRIVYAPDRDKQKRLAPMFHYSIGSRGAELKLRYKVSPINDGMPPDPTLERFIDRIILGPSVSSTLARKAVARMLEKLGKPGLVQRLRASSIPFRP
jgi:hypothetical protein